MIDYGLKNKVVLITGANNPQGIGAATALWVCCQGSTGFSEHLRKDLGNKNKILQKLKRGDLLSFVINDVSSILKKEK